MLRTLPHPAHERSIAVPVERGASSFDSVAHASTTATPVVAGGRRYHCADCLAEARRQKKLAGYERYRGRPRLVDPAAARAHLRVLEAAGMPRREIERRSSVSRVTLLRIDRGDLTRIHRATSDRILAVEPAGVGDQLVGLVDSTGTRRRLRGLVAIGWSQARLARLLATTAGQVHRLLEEDLPCTAETRRRVARLYDQLSGHEPPQTTAGDRRSVVRARRYAATRRWNLPVAWDDDEIDDPSTAPHAPGREPFGLLADIEWMMSTGEVLPGICRRLGIAEASLYTWLWRAKDAGGLDLWRELTEEARAA